MAFKYKYKQKRQFNISSAFKLNYKLLAVLCVIVLLSIYFLFSSQYQQPTTTTTTTTAVTTTILPSKEKLIVAAKDAREKLVGFGYATSLNLTISSIQIHTANDSSEDSNITVAGWTTIFEGTKTFDLLEYTDASAIIGEKELDAGKYTQIRLYISDANIKIYDIWRNISNKTYPMEIPNKVLKLASPFTIEQNKTTVLMLDFDVPSSVPSRESIAGIGMTYKLTPVVKVSETKIEAGTLPENSTVV